MTPQSHERFDDWPVQGREDSDVAYVGQASSDEPATAGGSFAGLYSGVYYDPASHSLFAGEADESSGSIVPDLDSEVDIDPQQTLGEALEQVGDEVGWASLSEFAEAHLQDDE